MSPPSLTRHKKVEVKLPVTISVVLFISTYILHRYPRYDCGEHRREVRVDRAGCSSSTATIVQLGTCVSAGPASFTATCCISFQRKRRSGQSGRIFQISVAASSTNGKS